jgi:hypothetical protein
LVYPAGYTGVYNIRIEVPVEQEFAGFKIEGDGINIWLHILTRPCPPTELDYIPLSVENLITFAG